MSIPANPDAAITALKAGGQAARIARLSKASTQPITAAQIRSASGTQLRQLIQRDRFHILDHAPLSEAIMFAKGGEELRRVMARGKRKSGNRVVRL